MSGSTVNTGAYENSVKIAVQISAADSLFGWWLRVTSKYDYGYGKGQGVGDYPWIVEIIDGGLSTSYRETKTYKTGLYAAELNLMGIGPVDYSLFELTGPVITPIFASIAIPSTATVTVGKTATILTACKNSSGTIITCPKLTWGSGNSSIVTVSAERIGSSNGIITGISPGTMVINCWDTVTGIASNVCKVTVTGVVVTPPVVTPPVVTPPVVTPPVVTPPVVTPVLTSINIPSTATVTVGKTATILTACKNSSGNIVTCPKLTWGFATSGYITISSSGVITGLSPGTVLINCWDDVTGIVSNICTVTITGVVVTPPVVTPPVVTPPVVTPPVVTPPVVTPPITVGTLELISEPAGARVYIDNIDTGYITPATIPNLTIKDYTYRISLSGYSDKVGTISIIAGGTKTIYLTLEKISGAGEIGTGTIAVIGVGVVIAILLSRKEEKK